MNFGLEWKEQDAINLQNRFRVKPNQIICLSFVLMISIGTLLLTLPISTTNNMGLHPVDALFVSTSASCVTGLTVVDLKNDLTLFGKIVMLLLIQVGGLGIMTLGTLVVHSMGYRFRQSESMVLQESLNQDSRTGLFSLIRRMIKYTFAVEGFFSVVLAWHFYPEYGWDCIGYGIFHSVSAFCNAGFDLFGNYESLSGRPDDLFLMGCLGTLIVLGGIGFTVMYDVMQNHSWRKFSLHTQIVLATTVVLIVVGGLLIFLVDGQNPKTLANLPLDVQLAQSFFTSVSCRTAGFNTFDLGASTQITQLVMIILMFIGASPLSTGGGIKSTTFFIIMLSMWTVIRGRNQNEVFGRRIGKKLVYQSFAIFTIATIWVVAVGIVLSVIDGEVHELEMVIFETVSAFGTVGMGIGITNEWNMWGKLLLSLTMLMGRVGILTFIMAVIKQKESIIKYPEGNIMIG
ncbi:Potassium uptake protein, integral membrane component, KtrB [Anaerovibrio sp. JC8]|uniref:TrkH family potassium uptake protein n=1 Tax=Anaerovibrio sp. JC8 TaxID=1240085 RepID=UPI000A0BCF86|nr:potassium transporter TrkG [Anaerovibrio sp. JC8]ORT99819.1 Potassium uptake protein, integral membrane component, KtrB [Anaerovibrio sp. JC8]